MPTVTCPSCGEKGRIPATLVGARIKCRKCETSFLVSAAVTKGTVAGPAEAEVVAAAKALSVGRTSGEDVIEVAGLDDTAWASTAVVPAEHDHDHPEAHHDDPNPAFTPHHENCSFKQYKLLTPKDKYFEGKFDLDKLEQGLNHFARQGWVVRGMSTPHVAGFSGGDKEQLIVLLER